MISRGAGIPVITWQGIVLEQTTTQGIAEIIRADISIITASGQPAADTLVAFIIIGAGVLIVTSAGFG